MKISQKLITVALLSIGYIGFMIDYVTIYGPKGYSPNTAMWALGVGSYGVGLVYLLSRKDTNEVDE